MIYIYIHKHTHVYIYICVCACVCIYIYIHIQIYMLHFYTLKTNPPFVNNFVTNIINLALIIQIINILLIQKNI